MTRENSAKVTCPACGKTSEVRTYDSINVTLNPECKEAALIGTLMHFDCPHCGYQCEISAALLYHDMINRFMVRLIAPGGSIEQTMSAYEIASKTEIDFNIFDADYKLRIVISQNQLKEKALAFESDLDDRYIEFFKATILDSMARNGKEIPDHEEFLFAGIPDDGSYEFAFVGPEEQPVLDVPATLFDEICKLCPVPKEQPQGLCLIDRNWANELVTQDGQ